MHYQDDLELVERVKAGDTKAFGLLFEKHRCKLLQMILHIVQDRAEAEDVVQEAFMKAYRAVHTFRGDSAFFTWLACIGVNTARNLLSSRKRRWRSEVSPSSNADYEEGGMDERTDIVTPEDVCACGEMVAIVGSVFETMNAEQRTAISLHEEDGLSYQEIADAMGSPIGTVRSRISDARSAIAKRLEQAARVNMRLMPVHGRGQASLV
jgi:RNA polymerase sigma-70 factor (ECF subfamily)